MGLAHVGEANRCDPCARAITVRELLERIFDRDVADEPIIGRQLGLAGEAGEIANKVKKFIRDGYDKEELVMKQDEVADELGDVLWYVAAVAEVMGTNLESVAKNNLWKLAERQRNGTLRGSGDKR